jgi:TonB family protein
MSIHHVLLPVLLVHWPIVLHGQNIFRDAVARFHRWESNSRSFVIDHENIRSIQPISFNRTYSVLRFTRNDEKWTAPRVIDTADQIVLNTIAESLRSTDYGNEDSEVDFYSRAEGLDIVRTFPWTKAYFIAYHIASPTSRSDTTTAGHSNTFSLKPSNDTLPDSPDYEIEPLYDFSQLTGRMYYPVQLKRQSIQGTTILHVLIDKSGTCSRVEVIDSTHTEFLISSLYAFQFVSFSPAIVDGTKVSSWMIIPQSFNLK